MDGNEKNNQYRNFPSGEPAFNVVFNNAIKLKKKYPDYFQNSVNFISVIHNKNSNKGVSNFFKETFQKSPLLIEVNPLGIAPNKIDEYNKIFKGMYSGLSPCDLAAYVKDKNKILKTPHAQPLKHFLRCYSGFVFRAYEDLKQRKSRPWNVCTGTCNPFQLKIFVTSRGEIHTCERIPQTFILGSVDKNGVNLNFQEIAKKYNEYFRKIIHQCNKCANSDSCTFCIFTLNLNDENTTCKNFMNLKDFRQSLSQYLSWLEDAPDYYTEIMKNDWDKYS